MTIEQKKTILIKIQTTEKDIAELERVRIELATSGFASATLSSSGGSKSYTRLDIDKVSNLISILEKSLLKYRRMLQSNGGSQMGIETIATIYS